MIRVRIVAANWTVKLLVNEEILARAIYESAIPVVSAVGHEIDFSISDFVADLRAPTPSAAAELIVPDGAELRRRLAQTRGHLDQRLAGILERWKSRLAFIARSVLFREPARRVGELSQRLDQAQEALGRELRARLTGRKQHRLTGASTHGRTRSGHWRT